MSAPTASAEIIPTVERNSSVNRDQAALRRIPTINEVPAPSATPRRGEVVVYSGISFGASRKANPYGKGATRSSTAAGTSAHVPQGPIEGMQLFTDTSAPGQIYARVMILEPGSATPREALITPMLAVSKQDQLELDPEYGVHNLVERANVEISRYFANFGPVDSEVKLREFRKFISKQDGLSFLFSNLVNRNSGKTFDLFGAYFAPGGAMGGVGVFLNTWL